MHQIDAYKAIEAGRKSPLTQHPLNRAGCPRHFSKDAALSLKPLLTKCQRKALYWYGS